MEDKDLTKYVGQTVTVVMTVQRRISLSMREMLYTTTPTEKDEEIRYWLPGNPSVLFYASDVHLIEISEIHGTVIRLTY
jgi:hypothetical protein